MRNYILINGWLVLVPFLYYGTAEAKSCAFCKQEVIENQYVYQGQYYNILLDYEPRAPGHLLIVPKRHIVKVHELSSEEWGELSEIIVKAVNVASKALGQNDYIILEKNGPNAFQDVPHVHFHLIFPIEGRQCWQDIFNTIPEQLDPEELNTQVTLFRLYFAS